MFGSQTQESYHTPQSYLPLNAPATKYDKDLIRLRRRSGRKWSKCANIHGSLPIYDEDGDVLYKMTRGNKVQVYRGVAHHTCEGLRFDKSAFTRNAGGKVVFKSRSDAMKQLRKDGKACPYPPPGKLKENPSELELEKYTKNKGLFEKWHAAAKKVKETDPDFFKRDGYDPNWYSKIGKNPMMPPKPQKPRKKTINASSSSASRKSARLAAKSPRQSARLANQ
jgi:hypothetical protein